MKSLLPDYFPYAIRLALSAWISFAIAASLHVENAFWAAMPVWVIAQSTRGLLLERALYRIIGTLVGAGFSIGLLHLSLHPVILVIFLGLWSALCSAGTHMIRGVRSYGILMAGITASVVILPTLLNLEVTREYAYARVECTLIGVIISTMIMGTITPKTSLPDFYQRIIQLSQDVMQYADHMLNYGKDQQVKRQAEKIMNNISEVDDAALDASAGSITGYRRLQYVDVFISSSLAVMASSLALHRRQQYAGETVSENIKALLRPEAVEQFDIKKHPLPARKTLLRATPNQRLKNALTVLIGIQKILTDKTNDNANQLTVSEKLHYLAPFRNWRKAFFTACLTGCTTIFVGCCVLFTGIQEIALAALAISMITMLISTSPVPKKGATLILVSVTLGILMAIYYRLFLQPHITNWFELVVTIIPFILVGAVARANKKTAVPALDANMCFLLGSQAGAAAKLAPYVLMESGALWAGAFIVTIFFILAPQNMKRSSEYWKNRILEDISTLLTSTTYRRWHGTAARHILRLIQDLRRASLLENVSVGGILDALNLGYTIDKLRAIPVSRSKAHQEAQQVLALLANFTMKPVSNATQIEALLPALTSDEVKILAQDIIASLKNGHTFLQISPA